MISPSVASLSCAGPEGVLGTADADASKDQFETIYEEHIDFAWRVVRRLGVSEAFADDVLQQAFLVVHRRLSQFEHRSSYKTWIFSILLRIVREHRRSMRRKSPHWSQPGAQVDPDALTANVPSPADAFEKAEAMRQVETLLDTLDDDKRAVFVLAELEQMSAEEISQATGLTTAAVYSRLRAARTDFERAAARLRRADPWRHR